MSVIHSLSGVQAIIGSREFRMESMLSEAVAINTQSGNQDGLHAMLHLAAGWMQTLGLSVERTGCEHAPVLVAAHPAEGPKLLLVGHADTVLPGGKYEDGFEINERPAAKGAGCADMKGGLVVMHQVMDALRTMGALSGWDIIALITTDEETGSLFSKDMICRFAEGRDLCMMFEPATVEGHLIGSRKGTGRLDIQVHGRAAHAGREYAHGRSAVRALADFTMRIEELSDPAHGMTVNVGTFTGGEARNAVPAYAEAGVDYRFDRSKDGEWIVKRIREVAEEIARKHEVLCSVRGGVSRPPKGRMPENDRLYMAAKWALDALSMDVDIVHAGGGSDGNFTAQSGIPTMDSFGVEGGCLHSGEEFVLLDSLVPRSLLAVMTLLRWRELQHVA